MRHAGDDDTWTKQEPAFEHQSRLVVQQMLPPGTRHKLRQDDSNDGVFMFLGLGIDPEKANLTSDGRPVRIVDKSAEPVHEVLA
jgi:hypothetical protein